LWRRKVLLIFWVLSLVLCAFPVWGGEIAIFPFSAIRKGMKATGKTVLLGTEVQEFSLEVIDVVQAKDITDSYFVVLVTDEKIRSLGGILAGMSGSPVYIRGKIAGALSHSFETQDHLVGVVTPIEAMLKIWKEEEVLAPLGKETSVVFCFGVGNRAWSRLRERLGETYALRKVLAFPRLFPEKSEKQAASLEPGSAIGVQLVTGDAEIVSVGTLTLRDGDRFLALGHPFLHRGKAQYFLSSVYVNFSLKGDEFPFKVGTPIEIVGVVEEDRSVGIAGRFGVFPKTTEVTIGVKEGTRRRDFHFSVVQEEDILVDFLPELLLDAIDRTIDRQSPGSVDLKFRVTGENLNLEDEFFWVSEPDIATFTSNTFRRILEAFLKNPYQPVNVENIALEVEVFPEIQRGWILSCDFPRIVKRGEIAAGKATVFLYRQGIRDVSLQVAVPSDFAPGEAEIVVRGRGGNSGESRKETFTADFQEYLNQKLDELRNDGVDLEILAKGSVPQKTTYTRTHVFLPFVLEGDASSKVWVN